jgi:hypothetical protein
MSIGKPADHLPGKNIWSKENNLVFRTKNTHNTDSNINKTLENEIFNNFEFESCQLNY